MRTYRNVIISMGHRDKVTSLTRSGIVSWYDEDNKRRTKDYKASNTKVEMSYADTVEYFRLHGYTSHPTTFGKNWRMMTKTTGETK